MGESFTDGVDESHIAVFILEGEQPGGRLLHRLPCFNESGQIIDRFGAERRYNGYIPFFP